METDIFNDKPVVPNGKPIFSMKNVVYLMENQYFQWKMCFSFWETKIFNEKLGFPNGKPISSVKFMIFLMEGQYFHWKALFSWWKTAIWGVGSFFPKHLFWGLLFCVGRWCRGGMLGPGAPFHQNPYCCRDYTPLLLNPSTSCTLAGEPDFRYTTICF